MKQVEFDGDPGLVALRRLWERREPVLSRVDLRDEPADLAAALGTTPLVEPEEGPTPRLGLATAHDAVTPPVLDARVSSGSSEHVRLVDGFVRGGAILGRAARGVARVGLDLGAPSGLFEVAVGLQLDEASDAWWTQRSGVVGDPVTRKRGLRVRVGDGSAGLASPARAGVPGRRVAEARFIHDQRADHGLLLLELTPSEPSTSEARYQWSGSGSTRSTCGGCPSLCGGRWAPRPDKVPAHRRTARRRERTARRRARLASGLASSTPSTSDCRASGRRCWLPLSQRPSGEAASYLPAECRRSARAAHRAARPARREGGGERRPPGARGALRPCRPVPAGARRVVSGRPRAGPAGPWIYIAVRDVVVFGAAVLFLGTAPGLLLWRVIRPAEGSWAEDLTVGFAIGLVLGLAGQVAALATGLGPLRVLVPLLPLLVLLVPARLGRLAASAWRACSVVGPRRGGGVDGDG